VKVIDASAVLALLLAESGSEAVAALLLEGDTVISAVNCAEVFTRLYDTGATAPDAHLAWQQLALPVVPLSEQTAWGAAALRPLTKRLGLSLGDRCCLALAKEMGATVVTADKPWAKLTGFDITVVR
jgi:ribonuclease VapC